MSKKINILQNGIYLAVTGAKIELYSKILLGLFRKKKFHSLQVFLDEKIVDLRKNFLAAEERHLFTIQLDI